jgi:hypothetical protein
MRGQLEKVGGRKACLTTALICTSEAAVVKTMETVLAAVLPYLLHPTLVLHGKTPSDRTLLFGGSQEESDREVDRFRRLAS